MFIVFVEGAYVWTGEGRPDDALYVDKGTRAMVLETFEWHRDHGGHDNTVSEEAHVFLLNDGIVAWSPAWRRFQKTEYLDL